MLGLVFTDWDMRGIVQENVGGLQNGIGEEAQFESVLVGGGGEW
jgi:hypothetical protein